MGIEMGQPTPETLKVELESLKEITAVQMSTITRDTAEIKSMVRDFGIQMTESVKRIHTVIDEQTRDLRKNISDAEAAAVAEAKVAEKLAAKALEKATEVEMEMSKKQAYVLGGAAVLSVGIGVLGWVIEKIVG